MSDRVNDDTTSFLLDALLRALETLPGIDEAAWDLDCLRPALRIARATGAAGDFQRADLAFDALSPDSRTRLLRHVMMLARHRDQQPALLVGSSQRRASRMSAIIAALFGRSPPGGATARDRMMRDVAGGR